LQLAIALGLLLLIVSGAAFWAIATYAQRHWPGGLQYVTTWIVSSMVAAGVWALASLTYDTVALSTLYCGFQDAQPCSRGDFLREQLEIWTIVVFIALVPAAVLLGGIVFFVTATFGRKTSTSKVETEQRLSTPSKLQLLSCVAIAGSIFALPPSDHGPTLAKLPIILMIAMGGWLLTGRRIARGADAAGRDTAWLWYSFGSTIACAIISEIYVTLRGIEYCKGIIGDPDCRTRTLTFAWRELPFSILFGLVLYLIPVLALVRAVTVARVQFAEGNLTSVSAKERRAGLGLLATATAIIAGVILVERAIERPPISGWGPLKFGMTPEEAVKAVPSVKWFDASLDACRQRTPKEGCQLDSLDDQGYLFEQGVPFTPTLKFNRNGELKDIDLDAVRTIDRREPCIALFERMLDWLAKEHGPVEPMSEKSLPDFNDRWRHVRRKTAGGIVYHVGLNPTNQDFMTYEPNAQDDRGAFGQVFGFIDSRGSSQCNVSIGLGGPRRYTDVDYE
jgi:fumarate reductase subunit D